MIFALSDVVWQAAIAAVVTIILACMQKRTEKSVQKNTASIETIGAQAQITAVGVRERLDTRHNASDAQLQQIANIANETHVLVNGNMTVQLAITARSTRRIAEITKLPEDIKMANEAECLYRRHNSSQAVVDNLEPVVLPTGFDKDGKPAKGVNMKGDILPGYDKDGKPLPGYDRDGKPSLATKINELPK